MQNVFARLAQDSFPSYNCFMKTGISFISFNFDKKAFFAFLQTKKNRIIFISCSAALFLLLAFLIARSCFRQIRYEVRVSPELYDTYIAPAKDKAKVPFTFVKEGTRHAGRIHLFGDIPVTAATLTVQTTLPVVQSEQASEYRIYYPLSTTPLLPSLPSDFAITGTKKDTLFDPNLSVRLNSTASVEKGYRAVPVNGIYAGQKDYALECIKNAVCTIYVEKISKKLRRWCEETFVSPATGKETNVSQNKSATPHKETVFISSVGDIMVARGAQDILINDKDGVKKVFTDTLPILLNNDITIGNLEGVVTERTKNATKTYTFKFKKAVLPELKKAGFTYLMQTNNHCYDYGEDGFRDTLAALKENGIPTSGVGYTYEEAKKFYHTTIQGQPFAIISCGAYPVESTGFNGKTTATATATRAGILWQSDELLKDVRAEKDAGYFVIVNVHGGEEYHFTPSKAQRTFYEQLCDSGADVVFGSHPHVLQKPEWYNNSLIVYSQGNFLFNGMGGMTGATDSEIVRLGIVNGLTAYCEIYPAVLGTISVSLKK